MCVLDVFVSVNKKTFVHILLFFRHCSKFCVNGNRIQLLDSVFKNKHKLVRNQSPVMNKLCPFPLNLHRYIVFFTVSSEGNESFDFVYSEGIRYGWYP